MVARVKTVAFQGIDCLEVDAEVQLGVPGLPASPSSACRIRP